MPQLIQAQTDDGIYLSGLVAQPHDMSTIIVHIHGMQSDFLTGMKPYFEGYVSKEIAFLSGENRGSYIAKRFNMTDGTKVVGGAYEVFEECIHDIKTWIDYAEKEGYQDIWLSSHSLGSAKVAYYMHETADPRVKGLLFLSPADNLGLVKDPEGAADHASCLPEAQKLHGEGKDAQLLDHLLWGDKVLSAKTYLNLFSDNASSNVFHYYDPRRSWNVVRSIKLPVIAFTGTNDDGIEPVINPYKAMQILERQLTNSPQVKTVVFAGAEHSFRGFEKQIIDAAAEFMSNVYVRV